ncbi:MAG: FAD-dependent oxidoreductase [bacterium]|nr:FAD-dependent oxidoreductase [bacterium]
MRRNVAIVGSGISGMVAAHLLHQDCEITVFEANDYIGGHTHTVDVPLEGTVYPVDTGFIVFTEAAYPNFVTLLNRLGVASQPSAMSFSVKCEATGLEYNGTSLNKLFAQRRNLFRPSFYRMLKDILRFYREASELLEGEDEGMTLGAYLEQNRYSQVFVQQHILPMGAAIWSASPDAMLRFPARYFVRFFDHHGFLKVNDRPQWRVIQGGSKQYAEALTRPFVNRIRLRTPVVSVRRGKDGVRVSLRDGSTERFDDVVLAVHSDQALRMLADPSSAEQEVLGSIRYQANRTVLHTDVSVLPKNRRAWASWNYFLPEKRTSHATVTYNMNMLQSLDAPETFCVTLNAKEGGVDPGRVIQEMVYHHPMYTPETLAAQARHGEINGVNRTYYCGAYWGFGFHEDGVKSALAALKPMGYAL